MRADDYCEIEYRSVTQTDCALLEKWYGMTAQFGYATGFKSFGEIRERIERASFPPAIASMIGIPGRDEAVGFVYAELISLDRAAVLWIHILIIDPACQGRGLGARAVNRLLDYARSQGATASVVSVSEMNTRGLRFWEKQGFVRSAALEKSLEELGQTGVAIMKRTLAR
jgi:GNAT superfamily N-acetyltransferase